MGKLTVEQERVLTAAAEGRLHWLREMGWFQKGGYRINGDKNPRPATVEKLISLGLIHQECVPLGETSAPVVAVSSPSAPATGREKP